VYVVVRPGGEVSDPRCAPVVYIVMTAGRRGLRHRLGQYRRGRYGGTSHQGGRRIWTLPDADRLRIGWRVTAAAGARPTEAAMIAAFLHHHGHRPFANVGS
jgi:hypothetical protein